MKIVASSVDLASAHLFAASTDGSQRLTVQAEPQAAQSSGCDHYQPGDSGSDRLDRMLDKLGRLLQARQNHDSDRLDARISRLVDRIKNEFDAEVGPNAPAAADPTQPGRQAQGTQAGTQVDVSYIRTERYQEAEATSFRATGTVTTADGRQIDFSQALDLARALARTDTTAIRASVIVPAGSTPAAAASGAQAAAPATPAPDATTPAPVPTQALTLGGSRLGIDSNGDGTIDPATELLGTNGNGFAQLQALDSDHNGFIDEQDGAFASLRLVSGSSSETLAAAGVGALYTGSVSTPYRFTGPTGEPLANLSRTGIYLSESGSSGLLQQVDFTA